MAVALSFPSPQGRYYPVLLSSSKIILFLVTRFLILKNMKDKMKKRGGERERREREERDSIVSAQRARC